MFYKNEIFNICLYICMSLMCRLALSEDSPKVELPVVRVEIDGTNNDLDKCKSVDDYYQLLIKKIGSVKKFIRLKNHDGLKRHSLEIDQIMNRFLISFQNKQIHLRYAEVGLLYVTYKYKIASENSDALLSAFVFLDSLLKDKLADESGGDNEENYVKFLQLIDAICLSSSRKTNYSMRASILNKLKLHYISFNKIKKRCRSYDYLCYYYLKYNYQLNGVAFRLDKINLSEVKAELILIHKVYHEKYSDNFLQKTVKSFELSPNKADKHFYEKCKAYIKSLKNQKVKVNGYRKYWSLNKFSKKENKKFFKNIDGEFLSSIENQKFLLEMFIKIKVEYIIKFKISKKNDTFDHYFYLIVTTDSNDNGRIGYIVDSPDLFNSVIKPVVINDAGMQRMSIYLANLKLVRSK